MWVNGTGHPTLDDMIVVGEKNKMMESKCCEFCDKVGLFCLISDLSASFDIKMRQINSFLGR